MIPSSTAAGLIAGMTQATQGLGQKWESLSGEQRCQLIEGWQRAIDESPSDAPAVIISSIAHHAVLAEAWQALGGWVRDSRFPYIQAIVRSAAPREEPA